MYGWSVWCPLLCVNVTQSCEIHCELSVNCSSCWAFWENGMSVSRSQDDTPDSKKHAFVLGYCTLQSKDRLERQMQKNTQITYKQCRLWFCHSPIALLALIKTSPTLRRVSRERSLLGELSFSPVWYSSSNLCRICSGKDSASTANPAYRGEIKEADWIKTEKKKQQTEM